MSLSEHWYRTGIHYCAYTHAHSCTHMHNKHTHLYCLPLFINHFAGIVDAYQHAVHNVTLDGPTNFSSNLDKAIQHAFVWESQQSQSYFIRLIITVSSGVLRICVCIF